MINVYRVEVKDTREYRVEATSEEQAIEFAYNFERHGNNGRYMATESKAEIEKSRPPLKPVWGGYACWYCGHPLEIEERCPDCGAINKEED